MIRNKIFCVALASLTMATSCSQDDLLSSSKSSENEISFHASMGLKSRATETTTNNLESFVVNAFKNGDANYMTNVTYNKNKDSWTNEKGTYFWPTEGTLNFYAYAPATPGSAGTMKLDKDAQTLTDFSPNSTAEEQKDFIYTSTTGSYEKDKENGVSLTFKHALSWIDIKAKNSNKAYTIKITDVKLGNIIKKGTFTFPSADGTTRSTASWTTSSTETDKQDYTTTTVTETTLSADGTVFAQLGGNFMVIPQTLTKQSKASEGNYIAVEVTVTMQGGQEMISKGWVYVGIGQDAAATTTSGNEITSWEMGKHYTYTLDFSEGVGQDKDGNCIFDSKEIAIATDVTPWDEANQYPIIAIVPTSANSVLMSTTQVYAIDIATKPNAFWTSEAGGSLSEAPITDNTEWTAEVVWQDIKERAFYFCDNTGAAQESAETYSGKGKTLYVQAKSNSINGNVVIGIKKQNASDEDSYIWSWHLWIAEDPLEINGFMDRNLGATKAIATTTNAGSDKDETYGCYYQFGRKDPMPHDVHYYKIDGTENETWNTSDNNLNNYKVQGPVAISKAVEQPLPYYTSKEGEWVKDNSYKECFWNDINGINEGTTKTFFDPCPDGWRLPIDSELEVLNSNFVWKDKGGWYGSNWFPAPGYLHCSGTEDNTYQYKGTSGYLWSAQYATKVSEGVANTKGYGFYFFGANSKGMDGTNRADGVKVRCVRDKSN